MNPLIALVVVALVVLRALSRFVPSRALSPFRARLASIVEGVSTPALDSESLEALRGFLLDVSSLARKPATLASASNAGALSDLGRALIDLERASAEVSALLEESNALASSLEALPVSSSVRSPRRARPARREAIATVLASSSRPRPVVEAYARALALSASPDLASEVDTVRLVALSSISLRDFRAAFLAFEASAPSPVSSSVREALASFERAPFVDEAPSVGNVLRAAISIASGVGIDERGNVVDVESAPAGVSARIVSRAELSDLVVRAVRLDSDSDRSAEEEKRFSDRFTAFLSSSLALSPSEIANRFAYGSRSSDVENAAPILEALSEEVRDVSTTTERLRALVVEEENARSLSRSAESDEASREIPGLVESVFSYLRASSDAPGASEDDRTPETLDGEREAFALLVANLLGIPFEEASEGNADDDSGRSLVVEIRRAISRGKLSPVVVARKLRAFLGFESPNALPSEVREALEKARALSESDDEKDAA